VNISFKEPYYNFIKYENIKTIDIYNTFINWLIGEFDLYQTEEFDGLKVYYPNGSFSIKVLNKSEMGINIIIEIKSKTLDSGMKIETQINMIYSSLNQVFKNI